MSDKVMMLQDYNLRLEDLRAEMVEHFGSVLQDATEYLVDAMVVVQEALDELE